MFEQPINRWLMLEWDDNIVSAVKFTAVVESSANGMAPATSPL